MHKETKSKDTLSCCVSNRNCVSETFDHNVLEHREAENVHQGLSDVVKANHSKSLFNEESSFYMMLLLVR